MRATPENIQFVATGLDHPEGINFGADGMLYAGGEAGQLYRIDPASSQVDHYATADGFLILGVTLDGNGNLYGCHVGRQEVIKVSPDGQVSTFSKGLKGRELVNPNYGVFDSEGNFYYTDSGDYFNPTGSILVVRPDGTTELFHEGPLEFPNGLAIDAEEKYLYVALSTAPNISRLPLRGGSAKIKPEVYVPLVDVVPDGMAFDDRGRMVISCYVPDRIYLAGTDGKAEILREDPGAELLNRPTNVALRDHKVYYANLGGWHVGAFDFDAGPMPLRYPKLR
jgi:gluconolactonase